MKQNENGFSIIETLLILVIVGIIGFLGWYVWHTKQVTDKNLKMSSTTSTTTDVGVPSNWKTFTSSATNLSFRYPPSWKISTIKTPFKTVGSDTITGYSETSQLLSDFSSLNGVNLVVAVNDLEVTSAPHLSYEKRSRLANGLTLWQTLEVPGTDSHCPSFNVSDDDGSSVLISKNKYLLVNALTCSAEHDQPAESLADRIKSQDWQDALKVVKSIDYTLNVSSH